MARTRSIRFSRKRRRGGRKLTKRRSRGGRKTTKRRRRGGKRRRRVTKRRGGSINASINPMVLTTQKATTQKTTKQPTTTKRGKAAKSRGKSEQLLGVSQYCIDHPTSAECCLGTEDSCCWDSDCAGMGKCENKIDGTVHTYQEYTCPSAAKKCQKTKSGCKSSTVKKGTCASRFGTQCMTGPNLKFKCPSLEYPHCTSGHCANNRDCVCSADGRISSAC